MTGASTAPAAVGTATTITRAELARELLTWTASAGMPLVVGNGYLAREVAAAGDGEHVVHLLAGMGLAPAVAAGIALASGRATAALEGDGNHLMGLPATATIGLTGAPVLHVVHWNGGWESTGGQRFTDIGRAHDVGRALGYRSSIVVRSIGMLRAALATVTVDGPRLVHAIGAMGDAPGPRQHMTMAENARRFRSWFGRKSEQHFEERTSPGAVR